jgi:hypothetical protein
VKVREVGDQKQLDFEGAQEDEASASAETASTASGI